MSSSLQQNPVSTPHSFDERDINDIALFLACPQVTSVLTCAPVDALVLCGNAILPIAEIVFASLEKRPDLTKTLVICGGVGHSTPLLYQALERLEQYRVLVDKVRGLPEARVYEIVLRQFYPSLASRVDSGDLELIIEDQSKNCGDNAIQTRRVLEQNNVPIPKSCIIVQDPTMSLRTLASFRHTYQHVESPPEFLACPTFVPKVYAHEGRSVHVITEPTDSSKNIPADALWSKQRFFDLLMGEIPRLRDDENGYGPKGKNFIVHVDIPDGVEAAWARLRHVLDYER